MTEQNDTPERHPRIWIDGFLAALAINGNVSQAATSAGITRAKAYEARRQDRAFAKAWKDALQVAADTLELEAVRRARDGVDDPVIWQGKLQGVCVDEQGEAVSPDTPGAKLIPLTVKKYSDTLLIFLLKGIRPKKYRDGPKVIVQTGGKRTEEEKASDDERGAERVEELLDTARKRRAGRHSNGKKPSSGVPE